MEVRAGSQELARDQVWDRFADGRWAELEELLESICAADGTDPRSKFHLATLRALEQREAEALRLYEEILPQRFSLATCHNNRGYCLARLGEWRAAFTEFHRALEVTPNHAAAAYNLAILIKKLSTEGGIPELLFEIGIAKEGDSVKKLVHDWLEKVLSRPLAAGHPLRPLLPEHPLEQPLFLWLDDIEPGIGYEARREMVDMSEAHALLEEGRSQLEAGNFQGAIDQLAAAADLSPALAERVVPLRREAEISLHRHFLTLERERRAAGDFEGAQAARASANALMAALPARQFGQLLEEELRELGERLLLHNEEDGWQALQALITEARQRVEDYEAGAVFDHGWAEARPSPQAAPDEGDDDG